MKKMIAAVLALMLVLSSVSFAAAEEEVIPVALEGIGMYFLIPGDMEDVEDADPEAALCVENEDLTLVLYIVPTEGETLEDRAAFISEVLGMNCEMNAFTESGLIYDHLYVEPNENSASVLFVGADGCFYDFAGDFTSENGATLFGMILGTLTEMDEEAVA